MTTNAQIGFGAKFSVEDAPGSGNFVDAVEVTDISPPAPKTDAVDATHMQSPNFTREFIAGLVDPGEVQIKMNFAPQSATDVALEAWRNNREKRACRITFGNTHSWTFQALVTDYVTTTPMADKMEATLTAKVSGSRTIA
jgi:hypothetical protein